MKYRLLKGTLMTNDLERIGFRPGDVLNTEMTNRARRQAPCHALA